MVRVVGSGPKPIFPPGADAVSDHRHSDLAALASVSNPCRASRCPPTRWRAARYAAGSVGRTVSESVRLSEAIGIARVQRRGEGNHETAYRSGDCRCRRTCVRGRWPSVRPGSDPGPAASGPEKQAPESRRRGGHEVSALEVPPRTERRGGPTQIVVNARWRETASAELDFDEIVDLAFDEPQRGPLIVFTITYRNAAGCRPEGEMDPEHLLEVQEGTIINVTRTDQS